MTPGLSLDLVNFVLFLVSQATINGRTNHEYGFGFYNTHEGIKSPALSQKQFD